jgi:hypothetical protein
VYHARNYTEIEGDPLYDPNRHARVQKLYWNEDGTPYFGIPVPDGPLAVRFRARARRRLSGARRGSRHPDANLTQIERSQFRVIPDWRTQARTRWNRPTNRVITYAHRDGVIWLEADDGSESFMADENVANHAGRRARAEGIWI